MSTNMTHEEPAGVIYGDFGSALLADKVPVAHNSATGSLGFIVSALGKWRPGGRQSIGRPST
jgi:hypothetical protein